MPPRQRGPRRSNPARYERLPGRARRYRDTVTGESISYHQWYLRTRGRSRTEDTATRLGFQSARERRTFENQRSFEESPTGERRLTARVTAAQRNRRRGELAERWAEYQASQGATVIRVETGKRRGLVNRRWAGQQRQFRELDTRLAQLSRQAYELRRERLVSPFFEPGGEYANTLVALGRRPATFAYRVGESPTGTAQATQQLYSSQPDVQSQGTAWFATNAPEVVEQQGIFE